jgi:hypothetical protein
MKADEIKKLILEKKNRPVKPVEEAEILGVKGWLKRSSSYQMEGWRTVANATKRDNAPDEDRRRLAPAKLIQISFCDEDGKLVFEELDLALIGGIEDAEINRVFKRCLSINGYGGEGIEAILKNLIAIVGTDGVYASLANIGAVCPNCKNVTASTSCENSISASDTGLSVEPLKPARPSSSAKSSAKG